MVSGQWQDGKYLAISGGVGGAKLVLGLCQILPSEQLAIVANTSDDFEHLGFMICPDLDTLMYTLATLNNPTLGWGQASETWHFLEALARFAGETWFRLGDKDLATHVARTELLRSGLSLSEATRHLCGCLGIAHPIFPMCDTAVSTQVHVKQGNTLKFQHYFVRDHCEPEVTGFEFAGIETAAPSAGFTEAIADEALISIVICPSNPFVSVDPVLKIPGVIAAMRASGKPTIAVSPIVGGQALKGPAAKMMKELGMPQTALAVAEHYVGRIDGFVIDPVDAAQRPAIENLGLEVLVTKTVMLSLQDRIDLAASCLTFASGIKPQRAS